MRITPALALTLALAMAALSTGVAQAQVVHVNPRKSFIADAVVVPAGAQMIYVSGQIADPVAPPPQGQPAQLGDTKTQAVSVIGKIRKILEDQGASLADVVMLRVILVGDP